MYVLLTQAAWSLTFSAQQMYFLMQLQLSPATTKCWLQSSEGHFVLSYEATRHTLIRIYIYTLLLLCTHTDKTEFNFLLLYEDCSPDPLRDSVKRPAPTQSLFEVSVFLPAGDRKRWVLLS